MGGIITTAVVVEQLHNDVTVRVLNCATDASFVRAYIYNGSDEVRYATVANGDKVLNYGQSATFDCKCLQCNDCNFHLYVSGEIVGGNTLVVYNNKGLGFKPGLDYTCPARRLDEDGNEERPTLELGASAAFDEVDDAGSSSPVSFRTLRGGRGNNEVKETYIGGIHDHLSDDEGSFSLLPTLN